MEKEGGGGRGSVGGRKVRKREEGGGRGNTDLTGAVQVEGVEERVGLPAHGRGVWPMPGSADRSQCYPRQSPLTTSG